MERASGELARCLEDALTPWALAARAAVRRGSSDLDGAVEDYRRCRRLPVPPYLWAEVWEGLCSAYYEAGRYDEAQEMLLGWMRLGPSHHRVLALCCRELGDWQDELRALDDLVGTLGPQPQFLLERAEVWLDAGEFEAARQDLTACLARAEGEVGDLARSYLEGREPLPADPDEWLSRGEYGRALRRVHPDDLDTRLRIHWDRGDALRCAQLVGRKVRELERAEAWLVALEHLERVVPVLGDRLEYHPSLFRLLLDLARLRLGHGRLREGWELYRQLLEWPNRIGLVGALERVPETQQLDGYGELLADAMEPPRVMPGAFLDTDTGTIRGLLRPGVCTLGPCPVTFDVSFETPPGRRGTRTRLSVLDPSLEHPVAIGWADAWLTHQGLRTGPYRWGALWVDGSRRPGVVVVDGSVPLAMAASAIFDLESGEVALPTGARVRPGNDGFFESQEEGEVMTESGARFYVSAADDSVSLRLCWPRFGPDLTGQHLMIPSFPLWRQRANQAEREWLATWLERELSIRPGQRFRWGSVQLDGLPGRPVIVRLRHGQ